MDKNVAVSISNRNSTQRKFFQWIGQWFYTGQSEDIIYKPDAPELACFLQAIGFRLREFEKHEDNNNGTKNDTLKIIIECGSSKMRAVMELEDVSCQCPNQDDAKDASFWSVSGTAPLGSTENMSKVLETGSNLLPTISKGVTNVIRDVTHHLFKMIKNIPDANQNANSNLNVSGRESSLKPPSDASGLPFMRRHTESDFNTARCRSLDTLTKSNEVVNDKVSEISLISPRNRSSSVSLHKPQKTSDNKLSLKEELGKINLAVSSTAVSPSCPTPLQRQKTFDMDIECSSIEGEPRPSPPKISSSPVPVPQLCMSLGQISLQSEGKDLPFVDFLFKAKANLEQALFMLANSPHGSNTNLDDVFLKPPPPKNSLRISPGNNSRPGSSCSLPTQPASRNTNLHRQSVRRNVATSFRKSFDGTKSSPVDKKSTPTSRAVMQRRSLGGRLPSPKPVKLKVDTPRPGTSSGMKSNPSGSRMIVTAKRRVSPDPKSSASEFPKHNSSLNISGLKTLATINNNKLESNIASPKTLPGSTANKFGFIKKKV